MVLDTLYKRAKTGKIQYWKIKVAGASLSNHGWEIVKESGQIGTENPIIHRETITQGKNIGKSNETTAHEQAISQAQSDWVKKHDEGYKSAQDLNWDNTVDLTLTEWLEGTLPQFNTDASGNVKPMLATDWKKIKKIDYPVFVQPKLDGVRCLMIVSETGEIDGKSSVRYLSRSGKDYTTLNHITTSCIFPVGEYILDGEIYSDELTFQEIIAAVKKQRPESLKLKFKAYDIVNSENQVERWAQTKDIVEYIDSPEIQLVPTLIAHSEEDVKESHDAWVQQGYEGAMIRILRGTYAQGQRSRDLLKVKEFDETEYPFLRWEIGQRPEDLIAVLDANAQGEFRAKMVGTAEEKVSLQNHPSNTGMITIKHFGFTEDGLPRFPIGKAFRDE
jgi:ATP-dependent DNA ligase